MTEKQQATSGHEAHLKQWAKDPRCIHLASSLLTERIHPCNEVRACPWYGMGRRCDHRDPLGGYACDMGSGCPWYSAWVKARTASLRASLTEARMEAAAHQARADAAKRELLWLRERIGITPGTDHRIALQSKAATQAIRRIIARESAPPKPKKKRTT